MPSEDEKTFALSYRLEVLRPALTAEEVRWARKNTPGASYCHAAVVLAIVGEKALVVESRDTRGMTRDGAAMSGQSQFEAWLLFTEALRANPTTPHAQQLFLDGVLATYKAKVGR